MRYALCVTREDPTRPCSMDYSALPATRLLIRLLSRHIFLPPGWHTRNKSAENGNSRMETKP